MNTSSYQCLLCKKVLSGTLDDHFSEHMRFHNVTHNQEFLFATFFLDVKGIENTIEFMMNGGNDDMKDGTRTYVAVRNQDDAEVTAVVADNDKCIEVLQESFETKNDDDAPPNDAVNNVTVVDSRITTINVDVVSDFSEIETKDKEDGGVPGPVNVKPRRGRPRKKVVSCDEEDSNDPDYLDISKISGMTCETNGTCDCDMDFADEKARNKHMRLFHSKYKCPECPLTFRTKFLLQGHILNPRDKHDPDYNSTECATCGETFEAYSNLKDHKKMKHGIGVEKPCQICGEMIVNKKKHFRKFHFNLFECTICGKVVKNIVNHTLTVHGSEEDKKFKCHICGKGFIMRDKLTSHIAIHSEERPFVCKFNCGFKSKTLGNLKKHESGKHSLNKTYPWNIKQEAEAVSEEKSVNNNFISVFNPQNMKAASSSAYNELGGSVVKTRGIRANRFKLREVKDEFMSEEVPLDMQDNEMSADVSQINEKSEDESSNMMDSKLGDKTCIFMVDADGDESKADRYVKIEPLSRHIFRSETLGMHQAPNKDSIKNEEEITQEDHGEDFDMKKDEDEERALLEFMFNSSS